MAQDPKKDNGEIKECVRGVVFMGTPHLGSRIVAKKFLQDLAKVMTVRGIRRNLLKVLEPKSLELTNISTCFERQTIPVQIVSMYEQKPIKKKILVSCASRPFGVFLAKAF
jgi:hypothetical protein